MATHFPLLKSYRFDMSTGIFHEAQDACIQKCMVEIATPNGTDNQIFRVWAMNYLTVTAGVVALHNFHSS